MFAVFEKYLLSKAAFTPAEIEQIEAASQVKALRKRQYLLQAGDLWSYHAFVTSGCLRTYSVDAKGAEHIIYFAVENWWTGEQQSLASGQPSRYNIEAIEDSTLVLIEKTKFQRLRQDIPTLHELVNDLLYRSFLASQNRIHSVISYSAEEKYREFLRQYPAFAQRIPQHMVASYLGVTTETLSRIRRHSG